MADALTGTVESTTDVVAYQQALYYALRPRLIWDNLATVRGTALTNRGTGVVFSRASDMAVDTTPLNEYADVDAKALGETQTTVTMTEYGNAAMTTARLRGTSFVADFDASVSNRVNYNALRTIDQLVREALDAGTNTITPTLNATTGLIDPNDVRLAKANLEANNVEPWPDGFYRAFIDPYVSLDLRKNTDAAGWRVPQTYAGNAFGGIARGELGEFEGFRFVTVNTLKYSGTAPNKKISCFFMGQEGLAKAYSTAPGFGDIPGIRRGNILDKLQRFVPVGWYWLGGYKIFRPEAVIKIDYKDSVRAGA